MTYDQTWDETAPAGATTAANTLDTIIQNLKTAIRERMQAGGMYFPATHNEAAGQHSYMLCRVQASKPTVAADQGGIYIKDVDSKAELHYEDEDGDEIQLTNAGKMSHLDVGARVYNNANISIIRTALGMFPG